MNWQACLPSHPRDANDYTSFENEEAQIQAVFREALRLKKKVKELTRALRTSENDSRQVARELGDLLQERDEALQVATLQLETIEQSHKEHLESALQALHGQLEHARYELHRQDPLLVNLQTKVDVLEKSLHAKLDQADNLSEEWFEDRYQERHQSEAQCMQAKLEALETELKVEKERSESLEKVLSGRAAELAAMQEQLASAAQLLLLGPEAEAEEAALMQQQYAVQKAVEDVVAENSLLRELALSAHSRHIAALPEVLPLAPQTAVAKITGPGVATPAQLHMLDGPVRVRTNNSHSSRHASSLLKAIVPTVLQCSEFKPKVLPPQQSPELRSPASWHGCVPRTAPGASPHDRSQDAGTVHNDIVKAVGAAAVLKNNVGVSLSSSGRDAMTPLSRRKSGDAYSKGHASSQRTPNLGIGGSPGGSIRNGREGSECEGSTQDCTASVGRGEMPAALPSLRRSAARSHVRTRF